MSLPPDPAEVLGRAELLRFAAALAQTPQHWRHLLLRGDACARTYEAIWSSEHVNAWVICWAGDADTGFHDHDDSAAGIVVLEGRVVEERLALSGPPVARRYAAGESFHLSATAIHRVRHDGGRPALTIHAYSPPLRRQGVYRVGDDGALEREATPYTQELRAEAAALQG